MQTEQTTENGEKTDVLPPKITKENLKQYETTKKAKILYWAKTVAFLLASSFLVSFASYCLIEPNGFTIGGVSGIIVILNKKFDISQWILVLCFNFPLVLLAFFFVKRKFAVLSTSNVILQTLWLAIFEWMHSKNVDIIICFNEGGERIFAALAAGLCVGAAVALAFKIGGSTGGADILAVLIQKKWAANSIAWLIFIISCVVIVSYAFVFPGETTAETLLPVMMSTFEAYIESKTNDSITNGFHSAIEFRIITDKPEEMATALMKELSRGVTSIPATGMYTKITHTMLLCVVNRRQVTTLRRIMKSIDPDSFAVMSAVSQVLGLGFYSNEFN